MNKKILITIAVCFSAINTFGQTDKKNLVGMHSAFGTGNYRPVGGRELMGAGGYHVNYYYSFGLDYSRVLSNHLSLCSGFEYTYSDIKRTSSPMPAVTSTKVNIKFTTIPIQLKYNFWKFFYVNGGLFFNFAARTSWESYIPISEPIVTIIEEGHLHVGGAEYKETNKLDILLGCGLGIGAEHEFRSGITLFLNPYIRINGIENAKQTQSFLKFLKQGNIDSRQFYQSGVNLGIGYKF